MRSIKNTVQNEIVIEKSRFITYIMHIESETEAKEILEKMRNEYPDATHIVYAYIVSNTQRSNDNGEPKGTAGLPSLETLRNEGLINVLGITIRYFGGIKLGASGLTRAYVKGISEALKIAEFTTLEKITLVELTLSYKDSSYLDKNLSYVKDVNKSYSTNVLYKMQILSKDLDTFKDMFINFKDEYEFNVIQEIEVFI